MAIYLKEADVQRLLTMSDALAAVEEAFRQVGEGKALNHPRYRIRMPGSGMQLMPAGIPAFGAMGFKVYATAGRSAHPLVVLYSTQDGRLLTIMEAGRLGQVRTGAASGIATKFMARPDASSLGVIGSGYQARTQVEAICAVRPIRSANVYSPNPEHRAAFARELGEHLALAASPTDSPQAAVKDQDIVIVITNAREPVLKGEWLSSGCHVNAAGANHWMRRELDDEAVRRSGTIVVDDLEQAKIECADLMVAVERGILMWPRVRELGDVIAGHIPGRRAAEEITLFESQGIGLEDIATAAKVYELAQRQGMGQAIG